jgi:hypothetical protein
MLGVYLEPGKGLVRRLDSPEVVFDLMLAFPFASGSIGSYDACNRIDAPGQVELIFEVSGAEGGGFIPVGEDHTFCVEREFMGTRVRGSAQVDQAGKALFFESAGPFENRVNRTAKYSGSMFFAMGEGMRDESKTVIEDVVLGSYHGIVLDGAHGYLLVIFSAN